jgi:multicomponent Na+:H+ antiporter subunit C
MSANLVLVAVVGVLFAAGVYLLLERSLTRVLVGVILIGNGVNTLFLVASGPAGRAPIVGLNDVDEMSDPLPQAMVLTAIVITLGVTAFLLAMAYRAWQLNGNDEVQDDVEDAAIRRRADRDEVSSSYDDSAGGTMDEEGADEPSVVQPGDEGEPATVGPEGEQR